MSNSYLLMHRALKLNGSCEAICVYEEVVKRIPNVRFTLYWNTKRDLRRKEKRMNGNYFDARHCKLPSWIIRKRLRLEYSKASLKELGEIIV